MCFIVHLLIITFDACQRKIPGGQNLNRDIIFGGSKGLALTLFGGFPEYKLCPSLALGWRPFGRCTYCH